MTTTPWRNAIKLPNDNVDRPIATAMLSTRPTIDFVLPGLGLGEVGMLVAPGAAGKSFWALQAAISMATGIDLLHLNNMSEYKLKPGKVMYVSMEDSKLVIQCRLHDIADTFPALQRDAVLRAIDANLQIIEGNRGDFDLMENTSNGIDISVCATGRRLVILDTLSMCHVGDENKTSDMAAVVGNTQRIARKNQCSFLVLHHAAKAAVLNGQMDMQQASRGSSALVDNIRCAFFMQTMTEDEASTLNIIDRYKYVRYGSTKLNHGSHVAPVWYEKHLGVLVPTELSIPIKTRKPSEQKQRANKEIVI